MSLGAWGGGPGPTAVHGELARHVVAARAVDRLPDDVIAAAREERALRHLRRRLAWWRLTGRVR